MRIIYLFTFLHLSIIFVGCANKVANKESPNIIPAQELRLHSVIYPNENLSMIALWYTGDAKNWYRLRSYNGHLKSPSYLSPGDIIRIPADMMLRKDQMTHDFVTEQQAKIRKTRFKPSNYEKPSKIEATEIKPEADEEMQDSAEIKKFDQDISPNSKTESSTENNSQDKLIENLLSD